MEYLRMGRSRCGERLVGRFNLCLNARQTLINWRVACIVLLFMYKGKYNLQECEENRGISLMSGIGKKNSKFW